MNHSHEPDTRIDTAVEDRIRQLESQGVDAERIDVDTPIQGSIEETHRTGTSQLSRPLGRALVGIVAGLVFGAVLGAAVGAAAGSLLPLLLLGAIAGALLGGLNALYSRLPMSSTAFDADGASSASVTIEPSDDSR